MCEIRYNLDGLQQYANQMLKFLPKMLEKEQWPEIEWIISIPSDIWNGEAAEEYRIMCRQIINNRDAEKVKKIPSFIKGLIIRIQEKENATSEFMKKLMTD